MITRIEAYRYRCFNAEGVGVDFGDYNILAGRNGAGKTTLLDIPDLPGDLQTVVALELSGATGRITLERGSALD